MGGQRARYLPGSRGFDYYLGIPYSDDMGTGRASTCNRTNGPDAQAYEPSSSSSSLLSPWMRELYEEAGYVDPNIEDPHDPAGDLLPLVYQEMNKTRDRNSTLP